VEEETFLPSARALSNPSPVEFFHPLRPWMLDTINHRTHRRILVVDGKVGFTGGAGVADVWLKLTVYDREVGRRLEEMFVEDLARSRSYTYAQWRSRPLKQRLTEWLILPFARRTLEMVSRQS
jgi:phosphatidylserine/phosphatidylglycerophosphate/cardiolipin synthase-like enzyme